MADKKNKVNTGIAGEFFVVAELTRRGYVASLTSKNTKTIDILASNAEGSKTVAIQVKTCDYKTIDKWMMTDRVEKTFSDNLFYVLVNMNGGGMPSYFIIPSVDLAEKITADYQKWINSPGANGQERHPTTMRTFVFDSEKQRLCYKDAWDRLGL